MISVVIPTFNRKGHLKKCLDGLFSQSYVDFEVIIVDDGSSDGTQKMMASLKKRSPEIRYFRQENQGHSIARNLGFSKARGEIIASLDDDCVPERDWLSRINQAFDEHENLCAVGGSVKNMSGSRLSRAHHLLSFSTWLPGSKKRFVKNVPTCNIAYKKDRIEGMAFADDRKHLGYRDSLFNSELSKKGRILFDPMIRVFHYKWSNGCSLLDFVETQKRQYLGFVHEGYKVHGRLGKLLLRFPLIRLPPFRVLLVMYRCMKCGEISNAIGGMNLLLLGECARTGLIFFYKSRCR